MSYTEDDLLPISALQHILFCERQCALIHIEQLWSENLYTAEGRIMHERVDRDQSEARKNIRTATAMPLRSMQHGLVGKADMVEFHRQPDNANHWQPFPVEYKRGKPKKGNLDKVQLCAQALCLEEMLTTSIQEGALFYGQKLRRQGVVFDSALRNQTEETAFRLHALISSGVTPRPVYDKKCRFCSLNDLCLPKVFEKKRRVDHYLAKADIP